MGDPPSSSSPDVYNILGISKGASSFMDVCKAYKTITKMWQPDHKNSSKADKFVDRDSTKEDKTALGADEVLSPKGGNFHKNIEDGFLKLPSFLAKSSSRRSQTPTRYGVSMSRNASRRKSNPSDILNSPSATTPTWRSTNIFADLPSTPTKRRSVTPSASRRSTTPTSQSINASRRSHSTDSTSDNNLAASLSKSTSRRSSTPIIYSQSTPRKKPPPIEKKLECTLEELCDGCTKMIKIRRDKISDEGLIVQEEEILKIQIKPGWKKGTQLKFEGRGDERPGILPADIIFSIEEKRHPIFKREEENLEIEVEIPLVRAITGCPISVPLLGGEKMSLFIDDVIYHGYEKIIPGQGMPSTKQEGRRGDLKIKFLVSFPTELSEQQRIDVYRILQEAS